MNILALADHDKVLRVTLLKILIHSAVDFRAIKYDKESDEGSDLVHRLVHSLCAVLASGPVCPGSPSLGLARFTAVAARRHRGGGGLRAGADGAVSPGAVVGRKENQRPRCVNLQLG
jgi:hypothetical protein